MCRFHTILKRYQHPGRAVCGRLVGWLRIYVAVYSGLAVTFVTLVTLILFWLIDWLVSLQQCWVTILLVGMVPGIVLLFHTWLIIYRAVSRSMLKSRNSTWMLCLTITKRIILVLCWVAGWCCSSVGGFVICIYVSCQSVRSSLASILLKLRSIPSYAILLIIWFNLEG